MKSVQKTATAKFKVTTPFSVTESELDLDFNQRKAQALYRSAFRKRISAPSALRASVRGATHQVPFDKGFIHRIS